MTSLHTRNEFKFKGTPDRAPIIDLYNETDTTTWHGGAPDFKPTDGPAYGINGSCSLDPSWKDEGCGTPTLLSYFL